ncbi:MAG TPA: M1 family aminopeptidase [Fontimonas sp.]
MLSHVARFELRYQATSAIFWITSLIFFAMTFWFVASDGLRLGWGGYVVRNSPYTVAFNCMIMALFSIFIVTSFVSNVILRDDETRFGPIIRVTGLSKFDYLFGRFLGALGASSLAFLSVPLGALCAALMPWLDPATVGEFRLEVYLYAYFVLCLPTLFILGACLFALATGTRSMLSVYVAAMVAIMVYMLSARYINEAGVREWAALFDPFGLSAFKLETLYWTPSERNSNLVPVAGAIVLNRALWLSVACVLLIFTWRRFQRVGFAEGKVQKKETTEPAAERRPAGQQTAAVAPTARPLGWAPLIALTRFDVLSVLRSPSFIILVGMAISYAVIGLWYAGDDFGINTLPVTRIMINALTVEFPTIALVIAAYYAGELVWRDRERRINEIVDATPAPDWVFVVPKIIAIMFVLFVMVLASALAAIAVQAIKGYFSFELAHYLGWYLLPWLITMAQYAALVVFIQMLVPNKYGGLLVTVLIVAAQIALPKLGWENHLYQYASTSPVPLSDMNGQGRYAGYAAWFRAYWSGAALLLAVLAYALWRRGASAPLGQRLRRLPTQLRGMPALIAAAALLTMLATGSVVHYNTHVLNEWRTAQDSANWSARYEKELFQYKAMPLPRITDVKLDIDIDAAVPRVTTRGSYTIHNKSSAAIAEIPVFWARQLEQTSWIGADAVTDLQMRSLEVEGARIVKEIPDLHFRLYRFDAPLAPGQSAQIHFETVREQNGFRNNSNENRVVENGTFLNNWELTPLLGVHNIYALQDRTQRRSHGLSDELRPAKLEDDSARANHYFRPDSDWVNADLTVTTAADQTVVAPGERLASSVAGDRRTVHFRTTAPIHHFFTVLAARYELRQAQWNDVSLEVYHHPQHAYNVDRMMRAMRASLDYYTQHFSPYQFNHLRIAEFPAYRNFAQAYPGTVAYSEAAGFILGPPAADRYDGVTYVTAHEIGHQWWAHQVIGADMQGQTVLSETLAQYSALMVMERMYGPQEIRRFLKASLDRYLMMRGNDIVGEVPLERVEEQAHIRYLKGGMVMYLLKDLMGEDAVNRALRSLIQDYAFKGPPYPSARDLTARLREQATPEQQALISDLFEKITVYDFRTVAARSTQLPDGRWRVDIDLEAAKHYADEKGGLTAAPLDAVADIGVFTAEPGKPGFDADSVLHLQHESLRSGRQALSVIVDREPKFVGVDPYNKYVDSGSDDNVIAVSGA